MSQRFLQLRNPFTVLIVSLIIILLGFITPHITKQISSHPAYFKVAVIFLMLMPAGVFMGIPFPLGLKILGEKEPSLIPWAWAVNGCFSVLAPILTIMLAMEIGFTAVIWLGGVAYVMAFIMLKNFMKQMHP